MNDTATEDVVVTRSFMSTSDFGIYALCYMQVCAYGETPPERIAERANVLNPSGVGEWQLVMENDPDELKSRLGPVQCLDDPARLHWMLSC